MTQIAINGQSRAEKVEQTLLKFTNAPEEILALCSLPTELAQAASVHLSKDLFLECYSNIYVRSFRAGERVRASISRIISSRLKWKVNASKSAVDRPQNRSFLGCSFTGGKSPKRRKIAPKALARFNARVKELTRRNQGRSLGQVITTLSAYLSGGIGSFGFCQTSSVLRDLDRWIRHRLRCLQWKQWKGYRRRKAELIKRGITPELAHTTAFSAKGPWRISHTPGVRMALNNQFFDRMGLIRLRAHQRI